MVWTWLFRLGLTLALVGFAWSLLPVQDADEHYRPVVSRPAFTDAAPVVVVDEGHFNVHTAGGRFAPFARLLQADGFRVLRSEGRVTPEALRRADVFVTANPLGFKGLLQHAVNLAGLERVVRLDVDAFEPEEVATLAAWVQNGGRALIAADHAPAGSAARGLAAALGVEMSGWWVEDPNHYDRSSGSVSHLVFSLENGLLGEHPIISGGDPQERVKAVVTFTGQSVKASSGAAVLLPLAPTAREYPRRVAPERLGRSADGAAQAVALQRGRGRVVVVGEVGALTAQVLQRPDGTTFKMGINREGIDNAQFVLNAMRWLMGRLD